MTKPNVFEEFVTPLLKRLENIQREAIAKNCDHEIIDKIKKVHENVEIAEKVLHQVINWEGKMVDIFGEIERHTDCMLDDSGDQIRTSELGAAEEKTKEMMTMIEPLKNLPGAKTPDPSQQLIAEVEQSSSTEISHHGVGNTEFPHPLNVKEIIEQNLELTLCCYSLFVFPKNTKFKKRFIIYWWIALDLLQAENDETVEDTANKHFNKLVELGVLVPLKKAYNGRVDGCIIEPQLLAQLIEAAKRSIIHDKSNSKYGCFHVSAFIANQIELGVLTNFGQNYLKSSQITECVKLLALNSSFELRAMLLGLCSMGTHHIEVDKTNFLIKVKPTLTYLSFNGISRITELPVSIGNLVNLIVLDLRACHNLEKLPQEIKSMNMLTHLDVSMCYLLDHLPKWVGSLINLEVLKGFVPGSSRNKDRCRLSDLTGLKKLRKLTMPISRVSEVGQEEVESLKALTTLKSLTIRWGEEGCDEIKEKISPPSNLEKLDFMCYPKEEMPEWFDPKVLKNLKRLYIRGGMLKRFVQKCWNVKVLRLRFLHNFEIPWCDVSDMFTKLELVECVQCGKMTKINTVDKCWRKEREIHLVFCELFEQKPKLGRMWLDEPSLKKLKELLEQSYQELKLQERRLTESNKHQQNEYLSRDLLEQEPKWRQLMLRMLLDKELSELWLNVHGLRGLCELVDNNCELMRMLLLAKWLSELLKHEIHSIFWEVEEWKSGLWKGEQRLRELAELLEQKLMSTGPEMMKLELERKVRKRVELSKVLEPVLGKKKELVVRDMKPWVHAIIDRLEQDMKLLLEESYSREQLQKWQKKISELTEWQMRQYLGLQGDAGLFWRQKLDKLHREEQGLRELRELLEQETELQQPEQKLKKLKKHKKEQEPKSNNLLGQKITDLWKQEIELSKLGLFLEQEPNGTELIRKKKENLLEKKLMGLKEVLEQIPETKELLEEKLEELWQWKQHLGERRLRELQLLEQKSKSIMVIKKRQELPKESLENFRQRLESLENVRLWLEIQRLIPDPSENASSFKMMRLIPYPSETTSSLEIHRLRRTVSDLFETASSFEKHRLRGVKRSVSDPFETANPFETASSFEKHMLKGLKRTVSDPSETASSFEKRRLRGLKMRLEWLPMKITELWQFEDDLIELTEEMEQDKDLTHLLSFAKTLKKLLEQKRAMSQPKLTLTILLRKESEIRKRGLK